MNDDTPTTTGLSGDHGWGDQNPDRLGGFGAALLVLVTIGYWTATWTLSGLPPLAFAASRIRKWRTKRV